MKTILYFGASGFLGRTFMKGHGDNKKFNIIQAGRSFSTSSETIKCDVLSEKNTDVKALVKALKKSEVVVLGFGQVSRSRSNQGKLISLHVEGTQGLLNLVAQHCKKNTQVVLISTSGTKGINYVKPFLDKEKKHPNEDSAYPLTYAAQWEYYLSKIYQEKLFNEWVKNHSQFKGLILNPSLMLGPGDHDGHSTKDIEWAINGFAKVIPKNGGMAIVDVRDVADFLTLAITQQLSGQYILNSANISNLAFFETLAKLNKQIRPRGIYIPQFMVTALKKMGDTKSQWLGIALPILDPFLGFFGIEGNGTLLMGCHKWYVDGGKVESEGFEYRDWEETLEETLVDVKKRII